MEGSGTSNRPASAARLVQSSNRTSIMCRIDPVEGFEEEWINRWGPPWVTWIDLAGDFDGSHMLDMARRVTSWFDRFLSEE